MSLGLFEWKLNTRLCPLLSKPSVELNEPLGYELNMDMTIYVVHLC